MYNMTTVTSIYVSQENGSDANQGFFPQNNDTRTGPLKTIEKALSKIAEMRAFGAYQPVTVKIMDKVYYFDKTLTIDNSISSVVIEPFSETLLSGGIKISGFKEDSFNGASCFSVDLSDMGDIEFSDFYVNGKRANFTKYPKTGLLRAEDVEDHSSELFASSKWFIAKKEDFEIIKNFRNLEDCFISFNHYWVDEHTPIESYDVQTHKITFKYLSRFTIELTHSHSAINYVIENVAEEFKNPNEWYFDKKTRVLYYIPENSDMKPEDMTGYIPIVEKLICIKGEPDKKVKNVILRDFEIAYTKGDYKSVAADWWTHPLIDDGFASDMQSVCDAHGGIELENAYGCAIESCRLFCFGIHCIVIKNGSSNTRIFNNTMEQAGAGGVVITGGEYASSENTHTCRSYVSHNKILNCGNRYYSACGVLIKHAYENIISHNEIGYLYYTGISCGWVWGYKDSICHDNLIEKNHIHDIGRGELSDMGGIYLLGKQPGTIVRNNLIHDVVSKHYGGWAIYTDEGSSYITIENNICYNTTNNSYNQHYGSMNTVRNNIFAFSKEAPLSASRPEMHLGLIFERNIIVSQGTPIFKIGYEATDNGCTHLISSNNNIIYDLKRSKPTAIKVGEKEYSLEEAKNEFGLDIGSIAADPEFEDIHSFNFTLKSTSPALKHGFKPIVASDTGC